MAMKGGTDRGHSHDNRPGPRGDCRDRALSGSAHDNRQRLDLVCRGSALNEGADATWAWVGARQLGFVTTEQLLACGLSRKAIRNRARRGLLTPYLPNVWRTDHRPLEGNVRALGAVLALEPAARISHATALHDYVTLKQEPGEVHVMVFGRNPGQAPRGVVVHRTRRLAAGEAQMNRLLPRSTITQALAEAAPDLNAHQLELAIATALHRRLVTLSSLRGFLDARPGRRGVARVQTILNLEGGPKFTRSDAEIDYIELIRRSGLPMPEINEPVLGFEFDAWWPAERVAVEVDSWEWHGDRISFESDHRRDSTLRSAGIEPLRFTANQIRDTPLEVVAETARTLTRREARRP